MKVICKCSVLYIYYSEKAGGNCNSNIDLQMYKHRCTKSDSIRKGMTRSLHNVGHRHE